MKVTKLNILSLIKAKQPDIVEAINAHHSFNYSETTEFNSFGCKGFKYCFNSNYNIDLGVTDRRYNKDIPPYMKNHSILESTTLICPEVLEVNLYIQGMRFYCGFILDRYKDAHVLADAVVAQIWNLLDLVQAEVSDDN